MPKDMSEFTEYEFTMLGTGTSTGVPTPSCDCETCISDDPRDKRLRTSALIKTKNTTVIIDSGPDFRQQIIRENIKKVDAIVYTHHHFDHIGGFDDLRGLNFSSKNKVPIYLNHDTLYNLKNIFSYAFYMMKDGKQLESNGIPLVDINIIDKNDFYINEIPFQIIPLIHGKIDVLGFRIGNLAYCTDVSKIPDESFEKLKNLDYLFIDSLRPQRHKSHFSIEESIENSLKINARNTYFIHIAHQTKHSFWENKLPHNIKHAYDGLKVNGKFYG